MAPQASHSTDALVDTMREKEGDAEFVEQLLQSLTMANSIAQNGDPANSVDALNPALYAALDWPCSFGEYVEFLIAFSQLIPSQSTDEAWLNPTSDIGEHQEVYDRLCHFYWLIDQPVLADGGAVQDIAWFSEWLVDYANVWGDFLDTTESFSQEVLDSFINDSPEYRVTDSMIGDPLRPNAASGWLTFNQFFARELNPGLRPILSPADNTVVVSPADCTYKNDFAIAADSSIPDITIKGTNTYANVKDLLLNSAYADSFANGHFVHFFLGPYSYHRFHTPVAGIVRECYALMGKTYLDVSLGRDPATPPTSPGSQFVAADASQGGYEFAQARGVLTIETDDIGIIAVIPVGMCQVSGVNMTHAENTRCEKGDEFGYFTFGGSDTIVLFQEGTNPQFNPAIIDPTPPPTPYSHYGTLIANVTPICLAPE